MSRALSAGDYRLRSKVFPKQTDSTREQHHGMERTVLTREARLEEVRSHFSTSFDFSWRIRDVNMLDAWSRRFSVQRVL